MKRIVLSLTATAGLLLASSLIRLPAARADAAPNCGMTNVDVTVVAGERHYNYDDACFDADSVRTTPLNHNAGVYNTSTHEAMGHAWVDSGVDLLQFWTCPTDPWIADADVVCQTVGTEPDANPLYPLTVPGDAADRHVLAAQLQNALNQAQAPDPGPQVPLGLSRGTISTVCAACVIAGQSATPTLPDLAITRISGDQQPARGFTTPYDIVLANLGTRPQSQVQVEIQVTGAIQYEGMAQTPAGFTCTGNAPIVCVGPIGGTGDAPITTSATFQVLAYAANAGVGGGADGADPNGLIQESNKANNAQTLAVTVK